MWVMTARVRFPNVVDSQGKDLTIVRVQSVHTSGSWKELTQKAEVVIPRNVKFFDKYKVRDLFRRGDPVVVEMGYDGILYEEFSGYITSVSADVPVVIRLEDEAFNLKPIPVNYAKNDVTLERLLKDVCPGYEVDALEGVNLGSVRFSKVTVGAVLEKLRQDWGLYSYLKEKRLICGKYYAEAASVPTATLNLDRGVVNNNLQYKNKEDVVLKINARSIRKNGERVEFSFGDDGGDTLNLTYYEVKTSVELEKLVKQDYEKAHRDGWDGSITGFGVPRLVFGQKLELISSLYPDRNGTYYIDAIEKSFDSGGYRQQIKLGGRV